MSTAVLLVGDVIDDVVVRPEGAVREDTDTPSRIARVPGGSAANTACWVAAAGVPSTLVATVGAADAARHRAELVRHGVRAVLREADEATGTIVVLSQGERRAMLTDRGANRLTGPADVDPALLAAHGTLHLTGHVLLGGDADAWRRLLDAAGAGGVRRSVSPGSTGLITERGATAFRGLVAGVEVLVASAAEAALLTAEPDPERAAAALATDHELVAVTLGPDGALLRHAGRTRRVAAVPARRVDVTGAGDAWTGGLLAGLAAGLTPGVAAERGAAAAARAVATVGARPA